MQSPSPVPFVPVVLGGDLSSYTLARAFHDELGVRTSVVTRTIPRTVRHSRLVDQVQCPGLDDPDVLIACFTDIAEAHPGHKILLLGGLDDLVLRIVRLRDRLDERFVVPYPDLSLITRLTDKVHFARACEQSGVPHPTTTVIVDDVPAGLPYPVIAKPASNSFHAVSFEGKEKVYFADDEPQLRRVIETARAGGYQDPWVVQALVPGNDSQMRVLTTYSDRGGTVRSARLGHVLMEDPNPMMRGNPLLIVPAHGQAIVDHATRLLEAEGWTGYANFDIKVDPRDGTPYFFELNPRLGRSHGYMIAAGREVVAPYVREWVAGGDPFPPGTDPEGRLGWTYAIAPPWLVERYLDADARKVLRQQRRRGPLVRPVLADGDRHPMRIGYAAKVDADYVRSFARHARRGQ